MDFERVDSPRARFHGRARLAIDLAAADRLALVVRLLAARETEQDLDASVLEIELERHERQSLLGDAADQLADLFPVQQQLALTQLFVGRGAAVAVRADEDVLHPHLAVVDAREAVAQVDAP